MNTQASLFINDSVCKNKKKSLTADLQQYFDLPTHPPTHPPKSKHLRNPVYYEENCEFCFTDYVSSVLLIMYIWTYPQ